MQKLKTQKGITLIALIITIIVMLILVGVSVSVALNGGLFESAKQAAVKTETEKEEELELSSMGTWLQNGTTVKELVSGKSYTVGATVTNYGAGSKTWQVLGVDNGKLLLTTTTTIGEKSLTGSVETWDDVNKKWTKLEKTLDDECATIIGDKGAAEKIRSIKIEDLNRATKYEPSVEETTIVIAKENITAETLPNGKDTITITSQYYDYEPNETELKNMIFGNDSNLSYWLASTEAFYDSSNSFVALGLGYVSGKIYTNTGFWNVYEGFVPGETYAIRPVAVMSSDFVPVIAE